MKHRLILMIGKGQPVLNEEGQISYRTARYIHPQRPDSPFETPVMGEAITRLYPAEDFDQLEILGTRDSSWSTLYGHCIRKSLSETELDYLEEMEEAILSGEIGEEHLEQVAEAFAEHTGIPTRCHLISVGKSTQELWEIFARITAIPEDRDRVSVDITHGLRFQPFIIVLAMAYFRAVRTRVKWGRVFYGALEMSKDYFDGAAPIMDLSPMLTMLAWFSAAQAFRDYGDIFPFSHLLRDSPRSESQKFRRDAQAFVQAVQFYDSGKIKGAALQLLQSIDRLEELTEPGLEPFAMMAEAFKVFPRRLSRAEETWEQFLGLATWHQRNEGQLGLAILATWEAVIRRLGQIYQIDPTTYENYPTLSRIARGRLGWPDDVLPTRLNRFPQHVASLHAFRNAIAHTESGTQVQSDEIVGEFPEVFAYIKTYLGDPELELLRSLVSWPVSRQNNP